MKNNKVLYLTQAAVIASLYVVLTVLGASFSFGQVQVRIAEALTILPVFTPAAVPGLFIGCLVGNILGGAVLPDVVLGSLATLAAAFLTYVLRRRNLFLAAMPPVIVNAVVVGLLLRYAYAVPLPLPLLMASVGAGELVSCEGLGALLLGKALRKYPGLFRSGAQSGYSPGRSGGADKASAASSTPVRGEQKAE